MGGAHFKNATAARNGPFSAQPPECCKTLRRASEKRVSCEACCRRAEVRLKILQQEREEAPFENSLKKMFSEVFVQNPFSSPP